MTQNEISEPDYFIAYPGGIVECSKAVSFLGDPDPDTGKKEMVNLPDRVTVTYKKAKKSLSGHMVKALHDAYESDAVLREWCEKC